MRWRVAQRIGVVGALALACAHQPSARPAEPRAAEVVWPAAPAAPRVRLLEEVTLATPPRASRWWRTAVRWLTGKALEGDGPDLLARPFDVALRADGSFLVADPDRPGVLSYAADGTALGELTCASHPWASPISLAIAADGAVWVADAAAPAIVRWTEKECRAIAPEDLDRPTGIALSGDRAVVVDPPRHEVEWLSPGGDVVATVGRRGTGDGELDYPTDVAASSDGSVWVVDALNFRIVHLSSDARWLGAFGERGDAGAALARPKGVDVDAAGLVYVSDAQRDVVLVFRPDGGLEYVLGEPGAAPGQLAHPAGLSARNGRLAVADSVNRRVAIFEVLGEHR